MTHTAEMTSDEKRLRDAIRYADLLIARLEHGSMDWGFWRGWRAFAVTELERLLRDETSLRVVK